MDSTGNTASAADADPEKCISVTAGTSFTFDVVLFGGIPAGQDLGGYNWAFWGINQIPLPSQFSVTSRVAYNTADVMITTNQGSGLGFDLGTLPPNPLNGWVVAWSDFGPAESSPTTQAGTMGRFTVGTSSVPDGLYAMDLNGDPDNGADDFQLFNSGGAGYFPDDVLDGNDGYGLIGIGTPCPPAASADSDGDGFTNAAETFMGTDPSAACPATVDANDEQPDAWAPDGDDDGDADMGDVVGLMHGTVLDPESYQQRSDFDGSGSVNIGDVITAFGDTILTTCD